MDAGRSSYIGLWTTVTWIFRTHVAHRHRTKYWNLLVFQRLPAWSTVDLDGCILLLFTSGRSAVANRSVSFVNCAIRSGSGFCVSDKNIGVLPTARRQYLYVFHSLDSIVLSFDVSFCWYIFVTVSNFSTFIQIIIFNLSLLSLSFLHLIVFYYNLLFIHVNALF